MEETNPVYKLRDKFRECIKAYFNENEGVLLSCNDTMTAAEEAYEDLKTSGFITTLI